MKNLFFCFLSLLIFAGCSSNASPEDLQKLTEKVNPSHQSATTAKELNFVTTVFTKNNSYFYEKHLTFTLKDSTLTIGGGQCGIEYVANAPIKRGDVTYFSGYTTFNQWFSDEFIQRVTVVFHFAENYVDVNGIKFYTTPPPLSSKPVVEPIQTIVLSKDEDYIVKNGDTFNKLSVKFGIPVEKLAKMNGNKLIKGAKLKTHD